MSTVLNTLDDCYFIALDVAQQPNNFDPLVKSNQLVCFSRASWKSHYKKIAKKRIENNQLENFCNLTDRSLDSVLDSMPHSTINFLYADLRFFEYIPIETLHKVFDKISNNGILILRFSISKKTNELLVYFQERSSKLNIGFFCQDYLVLRVENSMIEGAKKLMLSDGD